MAILWTKSGLLSACSASRTNAPIAVPQRSNCFDSTNSFFSLHRYLYKFTTRTANANDFSLTTLLIFNYPFLIFHCQLSCERLLQHRFFQFVKVGEFLPVDGFEFFGFGGGGVE